MCNSKVKGQHHSVGHAQDIDGRRVLQPAGNRMATKTTPRPTPKVNVKPIKGCNESNSSSLNSSTERLIPSSPKPAITGISIKSTRSKKPKSPSNSSNQQIVIPTPTITLSAENSTTGSNATPFTYKSLSSLLKVHQSPPANLEHQARKRRIAHYGRITPASKAAVFPVAPEGDHDEKRCSFITPNTDPVYVKYHDEEWGVPVHDDKMLFELLVLSGAQVGLDWTTILKKRDNFRVEFEGFDADAVSKITEKQMGFISEECGIDLPRIRGIVDNSKCILQIKREFGTFSKYLWGFVNNKPLSPMYRSCRKIPAKTSKSESISKDMVRRGFRLVGPTIVHSFMQAAGLTNDHLVVCPCHSMIANHQ